MSLLCSSHRLLAVGTAALLAAGSTPVLAAAHDTSSISPTNQDHQQAASTSKTQDASRSSPKDMTPAIQVENQSATQKEILFVHVQLPKSGWLVIHPGNGQGRINPDRTIGKRHLVAGNHNSVEVKLDQSVATGQQLYAMLHADTGKTGTYEFHGNKHDPDQPMMTKGQPVMAHFLIQMPADQQLHHTARSTDTGSDDKSGGK